MGTLNLSIPSELQNVTAPQGWTSLMDTIPQGVILVDGVGRYLEVNPAAARILGMDQETLLSCVLPEPWARLSTSDGSPLAGEDFPGLAALRTGGSEHRKIIGWDREDDSTLWLVVSAEPLQGGGALVSFDDISTIVLAQKRAENALLEREERYRTFFDNGPDGVVVLDPATTRPIEFNDQVCHQLGYTREEFQALTMTDIEAMETTEDIAQRIQSVLETGIADFETKQRTKHGEIRDVHVTAQNLLHGGVGAYHCVWRDITERKKVEKSLGEAHQFSKQIILNAQEGIVVYGPDLRYQVWNTFMEQFSGLPANEVLGKHPLELFPFLKDGGIIEQLNKVMAGERVSPRDFPFRVPSTGRSGWASDLNSPLRNEAGEIIGVIGMVRDITDQQQVEEELRESEERFKALHNASFGGISIHDKGIILECNQGLSDMTGYPINELIGMNGLMLIAPNSRDFVLNKIVSGYEHAYEALGVRKNGETFPMQLEGRNIVYKGRNVRTVEFRDITERKQAEAETAKLQAQLQQSQKMESLGTLAGGVAHDMNNVLGAILGLAEANLDFQPPGSPGHNAFSIIVQAAERGGKMVKKLLGFARQTLPEETEVDLNAILREEIQMLEHTTFSKIRLNLDLADNLRPIRGDPNALTHAFMNLCVNAVDAMPEGGTLTLLTRRANSDWIEVMVEDTGTGMPKEVLEKALDPFFTTKGVSKGTGLGLSLVYNTVKAHHGQLELQSEPGQGTCIRMRFPVSKSVPQIHEPLSNLQSAIPSAALDVLLVDDDELIQRSSQMLLEILGHTLTIAPNGERALTILESGFRPDVVILDMNMPGLGGAGTLPRLRALNPSVPVLLATGRVDQVAMDLVAEHPPSALLSKPYGMRELNEHLKEFLKQG